MTAYLLDTNHAYKAMRNEEPLRSKLTIARNRGEEFGISITVLGELYFACYASTRKTENFNRLNNFLMRVTLWDFDQAAAEEFGKIQAEQRSKGKNIPPLGAQIAAVARVHGLTVLTSDKHFDWIDNLELENWLKG